MPIENVSAVFIYISVPHSQWLCGDHLVLSLLCIKWGFPFSKPGMPFTHSLLFGGRIRGLDVDKSSQKMPLRKLCGRSLLWSHEKSDKQGPPTVFGQNYVRVAEMWTAENASTNNKTPFWKSAKETQLKQYTPPIWAVGIESAMFQWSIIQWGQSTNPFTSCALDPGNTRVMICGCPNSTDAMVKASRRDGNTCSSANWISVRNWILVSFV